MKRFAKIVSTAMLFSLTITSSYAALSEVSCSTDPDFTSNSCNQCFTGGAVAMGDNKGLLTDKWENNSNVDQVLFKEEQDMPKIMGLGGASWAEVKSSDDIDFWQFTADLDTLYDADTLGYTLAPGASVTWIETPLGNAYRLEDNPVVEGGNVGMLTYDIALHSVEDGAPSLDTESHRECVLYTSGNPSERLPETGAEHILLAFVALLLGLGFLKFRK